LTWWGGDRPPASQRWSPRATIWRMAEEEPKKRGRGVFSTKALREFRKNLPQSVVPVVLTVLGALAFQSVSFLAHFASEIGPMMQETEYETQRDVALIENARVQQKAVGAIDFRKTIKLVSDFEDELPNINNAMRAGLVARFHDAIDETEKNLGTLEGYTGLESTFPQNYLTPPLEVLTAELEVLETALGCVEHSLPPASEKHSCLLLIRTRMQRVERALARVLSAGDASSRAFEVANAEIHLRLVKAVHNVKLLYLRAAASLVGLCVSLLAYGALFSTFLESERSRA
jgi:hypothetical protein